MLGQSEDEIIDGDDKSAPFDHTHLGRVVGTDN
jgi:hypothetical protein